jgi:hypothetical protein
VITKDSGHLRPLGEHDRAQVLRADDDDIGQGADQAARTRGWNEKDVVHAVGRDRRAEVPRPAGSVVIHDRIPAPTVVDHVEIRAGHGLAEVVDDLTLDDPGCRGRGPGREQGDREQMDAGLHEASPRNRRSIVGVREP